MTLANFSLLWLELPLSPMAGFLVEVPLHSDGLCNLQFPMHFPPVSLLHQFQAVSLQVLILYSLYSGLMFFFRKVGFSLEYLPCVFLVLDSFTLWSLLIVLFLGFWISACRARIFSSLWEGELHSPFNNKKELVVFQNHEGCLSQVLPILTGLLFYINVLD